MSEKGPFSLMLTGVTDNRLNTATCSLCGTSLRPVRYDPHSWGERVIYQCDNCGAFLEVHTNTARMRWDSKYNPTTGEWYPSLSKTIESEWAKMSPTRVAKGNDEERVIVECECCTGGFTPRKNAKAALQLRFCPECRSNGRGEERMKEEAKAKRKKAAPKKTAKKSVKVDPKKPADKKPTRKKKVA